MQCWEVTGSFHMEESPASQMLYSLQHFSMARKEDRAFKFFLRVSLGSWLLVLWSGLVAAWLMRHLRPAADEGLLSQVHVCVHDSNGGMGWWCAGSCSVYPHCESINLQ
eukprot:1389727-Amphidinium_carterae.2